MDNHTIPARLQYWSQTLPGKLAFVFEHPQRERRTLTFRQVHALSNKFSSRLQRLGIVKGDVVCSCIPNSPERVVCDFGIMTAGGVTVPGQSVMADGSDVIHNLVSSRSKLLIVDPNEANGVWKVVKHLVVFDEGENITSQRFPDLKSVLFLTPGGSFLEDILGESDPQSVDILPSDLATIMQTSGSTGYSKLVATTHERIFQFSKAYAYMHHLDGQMSVYRDRPLGWSGGFPFFCIEGPSTQYLLDHSVPVTGDVQQFIWNLISKERINTMFTTPPFLLSLLSRDDLNQSEWVMDSILLAGQCVKTNLAPAIGRFCKTLGIAYGSTEAGICTHYEYRHPDEVLNYNVGKVIFDRQLKIVDNEFEEVRSGVQGQVIIKSEGCFTEYYLNPNDTHKAFTNDGWFCMDDTGFKDDEGRVYILGRESDLIMKGTSKVFPGWLESRIMTSSFVSDVIVISVPDAIYENEICACVIPKGNGVSVDDLKTYCKEMFQDRHAESTVVPKYFILMESFPCNTFGKTDKMKLKRFALEQVKKINAAT